MATIEYSDGTRIDFSGSPTQQDVEEAYNKVKGIKASASVPTAQSQPSPFSQKDLYAMQGFNKYSDLVNESATSGIEQVKQGFHDFQQAGLNPIKNLEAGLKGAAGIVNTALSPIAPLFKPVGDVINYVGDKISDIPEVQHFANSGLGNITSRVAEDVNNLMTVAGTVAGIEQIRTAPIKGPKFTGPTVEPPPETPLPPPKVPKSVQNLIEKRTAELNKLDSQYAQLRKASGFQEDGGIASRTRIASTDVLDGAVDDTGTIRTMQPGGAYEQYKAMTLDNAEQVVRKNLAQEGGVTPLDEVQIRLNQKVMDSGLEGADLKVALNNVKKEISGLKLRADEQGNIPNTILQDAKINTTKNINYQTPPEIQTFRKAVAEGYRETIEKNSTFNVKEVNAELSKYLQDLDFLKRLDGRKVQGGKLGKYFAHISGNIVGGAVGSAVGGTIGTAIGTVVGGELAGKIKGSALSRTFKGAGMIPEKNPVIEAAIKSGNQPKSTGNLNRQYSTPPIIKSKAIINQSNKTTTVSKAATTNKTSSLIPNKIQRKGGNLQGGFIKNPFADVAQENVLRGLSKLKSNDFLNKKGNLNAEVFGEVEDILDRAEKSRTTPEDIRRGQEILALLKKV